MNKLTLRDIAPSELTGKRVLVRVDYNVDLDDNNQVGCGDRITATLPTLNYLLDAKAKIILVSHLGRPNGVDESLRLDPVASYLSKLINKPVQKLNDSIGDDVSRAVNSMKNGDIVMLENIRFYPEEEKCDEEFSKKLASLCDVYINDAFGTAHRRHSSTAGVCQYVPVSAAGFLIEQEINYLGKALAEPKRPFVAIVGGSKVSTKIGILDHLIGKVDKIIVGGAMIFTFYKALGYQVGRSLVEDDKLDLARDIIELAKKNNCKLILPIDIVVAKEVKEKAAIQTVDHTAIPKDMMGLDIGPLSIKQIGDELSDTKTVLWNGPMGVFELDRFATGTKGVAYLLAYLTTRGTTTIVGGGDSAAALDKFGLNRQMSHVSTGGGASLEFLEGKELPGIASLSDKK